MIAVDNCGVCPKCGNNTLDKKETYSFIGIKYISTEYRCCMTNCNWFINSRNRNLIWEYNPVQINREEKLNQLGI